MTDKPKREFIDATKLSLDEWLDLIGGPNYEGDPVFIATYFPTPEHRAEFFRRLPGMPIEEVKKVLRSFLISSGTNVADAVFHGWVIDKIKAGKPLTEIDRARFLNYVTDGEYPVWEGIHWILDLLPRKPRKALDVLDAYFLAECQYMKDCYLAGHAQAATIIRHKFIESAETQVSASATLDRLSWREGEYLVGALYEAMGYEVTVTPRSDDGGTDVKASRQGEGEPANLSIQVRWYKSTAPIKKEAVRGILGAMTLDDHTSGVLVTTGQVQSGASKLMRDHPRLAEVNRSTLVRMLNTHLGTNWHLEVDKIITYFKQGHDSDR